MSQQIFLPYFKVSDVNVWHILWWYNVFVLCFIFNICIKKNVQENTQRFLQIYYYLCLLVFLFKSNLTADRPISSSCLRSMGVDEWFRTMDRGLDKCAVCYWMFSCWSLPLPLIIVTNVVIVNVAILIKKGHMSAVKRCCKNKRSTLKAHVK